MTHGIRQIYVQFNLRSSKISTRKKKVVATISVHFVNIKRVFMISSYALGMLKAKTDDRRRLMSAAFFCSIFPSQDGCGTTDECLDWAVTSLLSLHIRLAFGPADLFAFLFHFIFVRTSNFSIVPRLDAKYVTCRTHAVRWCCMLAEGSTCLTASSIEGELKLKKKGSVMTDAKIALLWLGRHSHMDVCGHQTYPQTGEYWDEEWGEWEEILQC